MDNILQQTIDSLIDILDINEKYSAKQYLQQLFINLSKSLDISYIYIGHLSKKTPNIIKVDLAWEQDKFINNFTYELTKAPCETVLKSKKVQIYDVSNLSKTFLESQPFKTKQIQTYIGIPFTFKNNSLQTILVLQNNRSIKEIETFELIGKFLSARLVSEVEKLYEQKQFTLQDIKLQYSEEKFKMLFELSPLGMAMVEYDSGKFLEVNQALLNSTGYTKEEFLALSFWDITPREYEQQEQEQLKQLDNFGYFGPNEKEYIKKDGTRYPIEISGFSLKNEDGKKVVWGLIEDITENKQYQNLYKDQKDLLEFIATENNLQKILNQTIFLTESRNKGSKCSILLLDEKKQQLFNGSAPSLPEFYNKAIDGLQIGEKSGACGRAAFLKQRVIIENISIHKNWGKPYKELAQKANLFSCWSEPIISSNNKVLGTFTIYYEHPKVPNKYEIKFIETISSILSKAIEKDNYNKIIQVNQLELEKIFNNSQSGLLYIDENRKLLKANQRFADILGYKTSQELIGTSMEEFHLNYDRFLEFREKNFIPLIQKKENFNIEYQLKKADGSAIWCEIAGKALDENIPADLSKGVLWTISDISLKKQYEKELKEKQTLLKNILSTIPDLIWLKDLNGTYLMCNPATEKFFGAKEKEIVGKTDYDFIDKQAADFCKENDDKALSSSRVISSEEWVTYPNQTTNTLFEIFKKSFKDSQGNPIGILGIGHDITERKLKQDELIELNTLTQSLINKQKVLLSLFDNGDSVLFNWKNDNSWSIEYVSDSVSKVLGYSKEDFLSGAINYRKCIHPDDLPRVESEVEDAISNNLDYFQHEPYRIYTYDKTEKSVMDYTAFQKNKEGNVINLIGYITDVTEQVKNQEMMFQQSKVASLGEMLGNIAHQWRQPLSIISTIATGMRLKQEIGVLDNNEFLTNMDNINEHAQYLSNTIDDFRNFFLTNNSLSLKNINCQQALQKTITLVIDALRCSNIIIIKNFEKKDLIITSNENLLIQALINIINNAKDALQKNINHKYIFIDLEQKDSHVIIRIKDNAGGIPDNIINNIFEPYFTTKHKSQGTGIGLYMTNQILTKHLKSKLYVKNTIFQYLEYEYKGACFEIHLKN